MEENVGLRHSSPPAIMIMIMIMMMIMIVIAIVIVIKRMHVKSVL